MAALQPRDSTMPSTLDHEQIVYYVVGGSGRDRSRRQDRTRFIKTLPSSFPQIWNS